MHACAMHCHSSRQRLSQPRLGSAAMSCPVRRARAGRAGLCMHAHCSASPLASAPLSSIRKAATSFARQAGRMVRRRTCMLTNRRHAQGLSQDRAQICAR